MVMEQVLYTEVVLLSQKDLKFTEADKNKDKAKFKFQGQSARSQHWFDLDFDWIEVNSIPGEPKLYRKLFQSHDNK